VASHVVNPVSRLAVLVIISAALAACSSSTTAPVGPSPQTVYWNLFTGASSPQMQFATIPLSASSTVTNVPSSAGFVQTSGMVFDSSGRLWVLTSPSSGVINADVFTLPITAASTPTLVFVLPASNDIDHITFDSGGNLWASDFAGLKEYKFTPPFTTSGTLVPAVTLTLTGFTHPSGIAVDASGNVYVPNVGSLGTNSIAVFTAPVTSASTPAFFLTGLNNPGGVIFDSQGNLYASVNAGGTDSIVRYNSNNLGASATPNIIDSTGLGNMNYEADFAFDAAGNLYVADCGAPGNGAGIRSYPLASSAFSTTLAPSATYTNTNINTIGCVWGIAIR
jgi:sugar lactone lactonase YvrE